MLAGREDTWVDGFVDWLEVVKGGIDEQAIAEYAAQLRQPGHTRASFEYFRTMHADVAETIHHRDKPLTMPVLTIGAEGTMGQMVHDQVVNYANNVTGDIAPTGHWVAGGRPRLPHRAATGLPQATTQAPTRKTRWRHPEMPNAHAVTSAVALGPQRLPTRGRRRPDEAQDPATGSGPANPYRAGLLMTEVHFTNLRHGCPRPFGSR